MFEANDEFNQQVQRFDTPIIRDLDFPIESGDQPMPGQHVELAPDPGTVSTPNATEKIAQKAQEPLAAEQKAAVNPALLTKPKDEAVKQTPQVSWFTTKLDPKSIPKYVHRLTKPPVYVSVNSGDDAAVYIIDISKFKQQVLPPGFPETTVVGYGGTVRDEETNRLRYFQNAPGATIEAVRNVPISIKWNNKLDGPSQRASIDTYPNKKETAALWHNDEAPGMGTLNSHAELAGQYLLRSGMEFTWRRESILPRGRFEVPFVIQDRSFEKDGSFSPDTSLLGNTIMVNGRVWPSLDIERQQYRFRIFNGSRVRVYNLTFSNSMQFTQIGDNNGFLPEPAVLENLLLAPGACADILADFSIIPPGTKIILQNGADAAFPDDGAPDPDTTGQIMQLTIPSDSPEPIKPKKLPKKITL